jgi:hypothetical protein
MAVSHYPLSYYCFLSLQIHKPNYSFTLSLDVLEGEIFLQNLPSVVAACVLGTICFFRLLVYPIL